MPNYLKIRFVNSYNKVYQGEISADSISIGKASYIYKDAKKGPKDEIKSFRQIITIPTVVNHFHRIWSLRLSDYLFKNNYINTTIQKGAISGQKMAILQQIYKLKNTVKHANMNKKKVAILFLDLTNAFGTLNREIMCDILKKYHIDDKFIEYIKSYYDSFEYYAKTQDWDIDSIEWGDGLIQGCPLSPILFVLSINYVLKYLDDKYNKTMGYEVTESLKILFAAFIDDICIVCKDTQSLTEMFNKLESLFQIMGLKFNLDKSAIMLVNHTEEEEKDYNLRNMKKVKTFKYLGEYISVDGTCTVSYAQFMKELVSKMNRLDSQNITNEKKLETFNKCLLPFIQRRLTMMYDLSNTSKLKVLVIIREYLDKWGGKIEVQLFSTISKLLEGVDDEIIVGIEVNDDFDDGTDENTNKDYNKILNNMITKDFDFGYKDINEEIKI